MPHRRGIPGRQRLGHQDLDHVAILGVDHREHAVPCGKPHHLEDALAALGSPQLHVILDTQEHHLLLQTGKLGLLRCLFFPCPAIFFNLFSLLRLPLTDSWRGC